MHKTAAPWEELREKYEAGGYTYMQLAKEYGVSVQSVGRHARKGNWVSGCRNERRRRAESRNCLLEMTRALMRGAKRAAFWPPEASPPYRCCPQHDRARGGGGGG